MAAVLPEALRRHLADLQRRTESDEDAGQVFNEALKACNDAGWSYRQLGDALGVSHFYVSSRIKQASGNVTGFGFEIPARPRPASVLKPRPLPREISEDLQELMGRAVSEQTPDRTANGLAPAVEAFFQALRAASDAGWDPHELALPLGMNPRAVARFTTYHGKDGDALAPKYPAPPRRSTATAWNARYADTPPVSIPNDEAAALKDLAAQAHLNRGVAGEEDGGALESAVEYTSRVAHWYLLGASRQDLEEATGQGWEALRKRLSRWGYMSPP